MARASVLAWCAFVVAGCAQSPRDDANESVRSARLALSADGTRTEATVADLLARSPVPVLAPSDRTLARPLLSVGREYAALTGRDHDVTIHVQATRAARVVPAIEPLAGTHDLRGTRGFLGVNEGIRTASWVEGNTAYSVDVECTSPTADRCQDDTYLLELVSRLISIGGAGR